MIRRGFVEEEKATKKQRKSICEQSKSRSLSLTEYNIPSHAREYLLCVVTARVVTFVWFSEISSVHPLWCVCALSLWLEVFNCVQASCTTHEETHRRRTCVLALKKVTRYCVLWSALHQTPACHESYVSAVLTPA